MATMWHTRDKEHFILHPEILFWNTKVKAHKTIGFCHNIANSSQNQVEYPISGVSLYWLIVLSFIIVIEKLIVNYHEIFTCKNAGSSIT